MPDEFLLFTRPRCFVGRIVRYFILFYFIFLSPSPNFLVCVIDTVGHTLRRENKRVRYVVGGGKRYQGKKKKKKKKKYVDKREREEGDDYIPPVLCFFFGYTHLVGIRNVELHRVKKKKSIFFFFQECVHSICRDGERAPVHV